MRNRKVKCKICEKEETYPETDLYREHRSPSSKSYYYWHYECFPQEIENRKFKEIERQELDDLYNVVKEIHDTKVVHKEIFGLIQDLRNGTERYYTGYKKHYKKGFKFSVIKKAYEMNRKKIDYYRKNKKFKDVRGEMKYCFFIVRNNITDAYRELKRLEKIDNTYVNPNHSYSERNIEPVKDFPME